jgi:hypothetical protein
MDCAEGIDGDSVTRGVGPGRTVLVEDGPAAVVIAPPRLVRRSALRELSWSAKWT